MGLFARLLAPQTLEFSDPRLWPGGSGPRSSAGAYVTPETALRISAVWACGRLISQSLAAIPLITYRRTSTEGRERARSHPLYDLLHAQPNNGMTAYEFKRLLTLHALFKGNGYARILPGARGAVDRLVPMHPARVTPEVVDDETLIYHYTEQSGKSVVLLQDEVFHLTGMSWNGLIGMSVIEYARESMGLALATEKHGALLFSQGASVGGVLTYPGKLSKEQAQHIRSDWQAQHAGLGNAHQVAVFGDGITYTSEGMSNEDAQFIATRQFQIADIARWFGVDLTLLQENSKSTSWGTGIEQMLQAFVTFTLLPWATAWEQAISRDLILAPQTYFAEYLLNSLVRGDMQTRYAAYGIAIDKGIESRNEVRAHENLNPVPGLDGYDRPLNIGDATQPPTGATFTPAASRPGGGHYRHLLDEAAERIVRKETTALSRAAKRVGDDPAGWAQAVNDFYQDHGPFVATALAIPEAQAAIYVAAQELTLLERGPGAVSDWLPGRAEALVRLAEDYWQ